MVYVRKTRKRSMRKRTRKTTRKLARKPYQTKFVRLTRWSSKDTSQNVHLIMSGNATGTNQLGSTQFRFNDTSGFSEIVSLFDNYCIRRVLYRFVLVKNPDVVTTGTGIYPRLTWVHDFNDSTPISRAKMQEHPRMREYFFGDNKQSTPWYSIKPASLTQLFEGTTATAYKPTWGAFVDTNDADMAHYGIKYVVSNLYTDNFIYMEAKIILDVKGIS